MAQGEGDRGPAARGDVLRRPQGGQEGRLPGGLGRAASHQLRRAVDAHRYG